ncbi:unnamed protein product [Rhodiola kirilowii]
MLKKLYVTNPFHEVITQNPTYAKFLKDIVSNRRVIEESSMVALNVECSAIVQSRMPRKMQDHGSFSIPISLGKIEIDRALCDLGASISLIPYSLFEKIDVGELHLTTISLKLADRSSRIPRGVLRDVPIKVGKFFIVVDFYVLEMDDEQETPVILGRPFLNTVEAVIRCGEGSIELKIGDEKLKNFLKNAMRAPTSSSECNLLDISCENLKLTSFESEVMKLDYSSMPFTSVMDMEDEEMCDLTLAEGEQVLDAHKGKEDPVPRSKEFEGELKPLPSNLRLGCYKNSKIYKEKTRRWNNKPILKKEFSEGDKVLLFKSKYKLFPWKFKSRWFGPYRIHKVFNDGRLELVGDQGNVFKANRQRVKVYHVADGDQNTLEAPS